MIAYPHMLVPAAEKAGIVCPPDPENYVADEFPHFHFFCCAQLGQPMPSPGCHWENAEVVRKIANEAELKSITLEQLIERGFQIGNSSLNA